MRYDSISSDVLSQRMLRIPYQIRLGKISGYAQPLITMLDSEESERNCIAITGTSS